MSVSRTMNINIEIRNDIKKLVRQLVYVYNIDSQRLHRADDSRQDETVAATTELSLFMNRCIKP